MSEEIIESQELVKVEDVGAAPTEPVKPSEEQMAYMSLTSNFRKFCELIMHYKGSKKQLQQTWMDVAIAPFNKEDFTFSYPDQKVLFDTFIELNYAKFILMLQGLEKDGRIKILKPIIERPQAEVLTEVASTEAEGIKE